MTDRVGDCRLCSRHWAVLVGGVGMVAFAMAAAVSWLLPFTPRVHDEFSYLLAADTLLHGRLANPAPQLWQPFQSFHIVLQPSYASKYSLGLTLLIALGWGVLGTPIAGCWLAAGICASSITWMLAGLTSRRWAVLGGLMVACHPALQLAWSQHLMSGWLAAAGSALLAGGIFRLRRRHSHLAAGISGLGVGLLAITRPFEGLVATLLLSVLCWGLWHRRGRADKLWSIARALPAASLPIAAALTLILMQNWAVTGRLSRMSYQLHEQQYGVAPLFVFGQQQVPVMEIQGQWPAVVRDFHYGWSLDSFHNRAGLIGWLKGVGESVTVLWGLGLFLILLPLVTAGWWGRFRLPLWLAAVVSLQVLVSAAVCWVFLHYLAPVIPWLVALATLGLRRVFRVFAKASWVSLSQPQHFVGILLVAQSLLLVTHGLRSNTNDASDWARHRAQIARGLEQLPGQHLVLVHYSAEHNPHQEWVYNLADLDGAKVLWARGERSDWNAQLIQRYRASHWIWELAADAPAARLELKLRPDSSHGER